MGKGDLWAMCSKQDKNYKALAWEVGIMISDIISQEMPPPYVPQTTRGLIFLLLDKKKYLTLPARFKRDALTDNRFGDDLEGADSN